jgi:LysR family transcriptional regulator, low CO2-responsive transcriptional regulator
MFPSSFRRLEVFITVVESGGFIAGAERLGISHPSVSNHIKSLERQVGCKLFTRRKGRGSSLTEQGRRLYERATRLVQEASLLTKDLAPNRAALKRPRFALGTQRVLAEYILRRPICEFVRDEEDLELVVDAGTFEDAIETIVKGAVDLGCVINFGPIAELETEVIGQERIGFFVAPHHPLARRKKISVPELNDQSFVSTRRDGHYGQMLLNLLSSIGLHEYRVVHQIQEGAVLNELAAQGRVVACGFVPAAEAFLHNNLLVELSIDAPPLLADLHLIFPPKRRPGRLAIKFADILRNSHFAHYRGGKKLTGSR